MASSKVDVEQVPLLQVPTAGPKVAPRRFKEEWYHIVGDGSAPDVAATCLAWKIPCVAWAWNQNRSFRASFWCELLRFIALAISIFAVMQAGCCLIMHSLCPEAMPTMMEDNDDNMPHHGGPHDGPHDPLPEECLARIAPAYLALTALVLAMCVSLALVFARRRTAMREQFGIEGSAKQDCLLYFFCAPCALAQETRTLMHENVHEGVWYGTLPGVVAPQSQKMAV